MQKAAFKTATRYTVTLRDENGRLMPANLYVYRTYDDFMIVRFTANDGLLRKIAYDEVEKVVQEKPVDNHHIYSTPSALLEEKFWAGRKVIQHYATGPGLGK